MTAPAHVLVFRPLIRLLRERGAEIEVTSRRLRADAWSSSLCTGSRASSSGTTAAARAWASSRADAAAPALGAGRRPTPLRLRARARLARADARRAPARCSELDDVRLRVRAASAPARLPRRDARRRARGDPAERLAPYGVRAAEAGSLPGPEGGVLPRRLRAGSGRLDALGVEPRASSSSFGRRRTSPLPPPARTRSSRSLLEHLGRARGRARRRRAANRRAARDVAALDLPSLVVPEARSTRRA